MEEEQEQKSNLAMFAIPKAEQQKAIKNLINGRTPVEEVKQRAMRGGGTANYVNTYYMTRQISLITNYRWTSECLEERILDKEIGCRMKVTIYDKDGNAYSQTSWGQKDIARYSKDDVNGNYKKGDPMSIFDDLKAAYSDGIKKCLSYFGIANDIYGGKELEYFADDSTGNSGVTLTVNQSKRIFDKYVTENGLRYSEVFSMLGINSTSDIKDYKEAYLKLKQKVEEVNKTVEKVN